VLQEFEQACMELAELVEEYEPELMRLPGNAPKYALAQAVQVSWIYPNCNFWHNIRLHRHKVFFVLQQLQVSMTYKTLMCRSMGSASREHFACFSELKSSCSTVIPASSWDMHWAKLRLPVRPEGYVACCIVFHQKGSAFVNCRSAQEYVRAV